MYVQTDQFLRPASVTSSIADHAVPLNRYFARLLGWQIHFDSILHILGLTFYKPDERSFAFAVAHWQQKNGLPVSAILGPSTWLTMRPAIVVAQPSSTSWTQFSGPGEDTKFKEKIAGFQKKFTFPFWNLPEAKILVENQDGSVRFLVNGVFIHMLPDEFLTDGDLRTKHNLTFQAKGSSFTAGKTMYWWIKNLFDPKTVKYHAIDDPTTNRKIWMVTDYDEPTFEMAIQVFYRKSQRTPSLYKARNALSAYGKGRTLQEHERWHIADAIDFIRRTRPRFDFGYGMPSEELNNQLRSFYQSASNIGKIIEQFSKVQTDCSGKRKAGFCP